jgi:hypothetical protein
VAYLVVCPEDDCMRKREVAYLEWVVVDAEEKGSKKEERNARCPKSELEEMN